MLENLRRLILVVLCMVLSGSLAVAQSHFMYIQSEEGTPFYIKMKDSILSSTQSGYLVLNQVRKGTYPIIVGLAKKKVPEAAFKIVIDDSGDKGYMLRTMAGKLQLVNIQSKQVLQPAEVATSAGNRILPSTIAGIGEEQTEQQESQQPEAEPLAGTTPPSATAGEKPAEASPAAPEENPFETMLNAVTGGSTPSQPVTKKEEPAAAEAQPEENASTAADVATVAAPEEKKPEAEDKKKEPSFFDLLNPDSNTAAKERQEPQPAIMPETAQPDPASPPANAAPNLTFIDFPSDAEQGKQEEKADNVQPNVRADDNVYNDTIITSGKELRKWKRQQRLAKQQKNNPEGSLFDRLLEKVDTVAVDSGSSSVASPLFGDDQRQQEEVAGASNVLCNEIADEQYFNKVRRRVASKKSAEAMLRTANRYLSDDKCYTVGQIKQLAYLFPSDDFRLQFLKTAYLHCSDKDDYQSLVETLSSQHYQNRLKDYIR